MTTDRFTKSLKLKTSRFREKVDKCTSKKKEDDLFQVTPKDRSKTSLGPPDAPHELPDPPGSPKGPPRTPQGLPRTLHFLRKRSGGFARSASGYISI